MDAVYIAARASHKNGQDLAFATCLNESAAVAANASMAAAAANVAPNASASLAAARGVVQGLLLKYCAGPACPSQAAVRAETRVDALQRLWNRHAPVLTKDGGVTFDFARERERLGGFVPIGMYVYNRPHYLRQVLANLRSARGVEHVLLVVSLDATRQEMVDEVLRAAEFVAGVRLLLHPSPSRKEVPFRSVPNAYHPLSLENDRCRHAGPS